MRKKKLLLAVLTITKLVALGKKNQWSKIETQHQHNLALDILSLCVVNLPLEQGSTGLLHTITELSYCVLSLKPCPHFSYLDISLNDRTFS